MLSFHVCAQIDCKSVIRLVLRSTSSIALHLLAAMLLFPFFVFLTSPLGHVGAAPAAPRDASVQAETSAEAASRANAVKIAFVQAWNGYYEYVERLVTLSEVANIV